MNQSSSSQSQLQTTKAAEKTRAIHTRLVISVWEVLIPVCVAVLILSLAVAAFLLGGK